VARSDLVTQLLGLPNDWMATDGALQFFCGNIVPPNLRPFATVYSGHQFGVWAGQLGDGRALCLGQTLDGWELQLKGAGPTPYSRRGDGRAVLRSSIREFLCSEAMHGLGIPTTRALCIIGSNDSVYREQRETAAVVTRVAQSFIRFGHFEHFSSRGQTEALRTLADFVIQQHYPDSLSHPNPYLALLQAVTVRTAHLLADWQAAGFCHGVMNTDNMSILGLTLDYGPFQFLDRYDPCHICNHSDTQGRYAYGQQPRVAYWNLFCLGQALLPLIKDQKQAIQALEIYQSVYAQAVQQRFQLKLGLVHLQSEQELQRLSTLLETLLTLLASNPVDYPIFWRQLSAFAEHQDPGQLLASFVQTADMTDWLSRYRELLSHGDHAASVQTMLRHNPIYVMRNHLGELAIREAQAGQFKGVKQLLFLLENPYIEHKGFESYAERPPEWASSIEISCSS
jgi:uncharacterized protein YdiU (UPF0061 family)